MIDKRDITPRNQEDACGIAFGLMDRIIELADEAATKLRGADLSKGVDLGGGDMQTQAHASLQYLLSDICELLRHATNVDVAAAGVSEVPPPPGSAPDGPH